MNRLSARFIWIFIALSVTALGLVAAVSAAPPGSTDLRITKTANSSSVNVGSNLTYTIQVENLGPEAATGVTVTDRLPSEVDFVSATSTVGQCATQGQQVVCNIGGLETGPAAKVSGATVTLTVVVRKSGTITNTASVDGDQQDPVGSNDRAAVTVRAASKAAASCGGVAANIVGTPGANQLTGTAGRDVIAALGGNDTIVSLAGPDLVCAAGGNDVANAGAGSDRVLAGAGSDRVLGRGGPDVLKGSGGGDVLKGNAGSDRLRGGRGVDTCRGGAGVDSIRGCER
jgi:uncharacterized repeat protein (TIGR01451 family)